MYIQIKKHHKSIIKKNKNYDSIIVWFPNPTPKLTSNQKTESFDLNGTDFDK